jgi:hypothetical protein
MATIAIDTYKVIKRLQERGFTKEQAEALVSVAQEVDISNVRVRPTYRICASNYNKRFIAKHGTSSVRYSPRELS